MPSIMRQVIDNSALAFTSFTHRASRRGRLRSRSLLGSLLQKIIASGTCTVLDMGFPKPMELLALVSFFKLFGEPRSEDVSQSPIVSTNALEEKAYCERL